MKSALAQTGPVTPTRKPLCLPQQAQQSLEFAEALAHFLIVLSSRVNKGIHDAKTN